MGIAVAPEATAVIKHLAHELRQPLSTIESIAFFLEMVLPPTESKALEQIEKLQDLVEQANAVLGDAIHYLQAAPPRPVALDINSLIARCFDEEFYPCAESLRFEPASELPLVHLDVVQAEHLVRTVSMLMSRLIDPAGPVLFRTSFAAGQVQLEISCPSASLSPETMCALMTPFHPHSNGTSGLAFASVRRIVEVHGGRVVVQPGALLLSFPAL